MTTKRKKPETLRDRQQQVENDWHCYFNELKRKLGVMEKGGTTNAIDHTK